MALLFERSAIHSVSLDDSFILKGPIEAGKRVVKDNRLSMNYCAEVSILHMSDMRYMSMKGRKKSTLLGRNAFV